MRLLVERTLLGHTDKEKAMKLMKTSAAVLVALGLATASSFAATEKEMPGVT